MSITQVISLILNHNNFWIDQAFALKVENSYEQNALN